MLVNLKISHVLEDIGRKACKELISWEEKESIEQLFSTSFLLQKYKGGGKKKDKAKITRIKIQRSKKFHYFFHQELDYFSPSRSCLYK